MCQIDAIFNRLDIPWPFAENDDENVSPEEYAVITDYRVALCFPNLSFEERNAISGVHLIRRSISLLTSFPKKSLKPTEVEQYTIDLMDETERYAFNKQALERYGLRAKISDFQEKLLDYILNDDYANT